MRLIKPKSHFLSWYMVYRGISWYIVVYYGVWYMRHFSSILYSSFFVYFAGTFRPAF